MIGSIYIPPKSSRKRPRSFRQPPEGPRVARALPSFEREARRPPFRRESTVELKGCVLLTVVLSIFIFLSPVRFPPRYQSAIFFAITRKILLL